MINNFYDIIIVGAGPAGSTAARFAAKNGASVLVLEKDRDVGYPVRCGEAVSHAGLIQFIEPDKKFITSTCTKLNFISPKGFKAAVPIDGTGYVLERRVFDYELSKIAAECGAKFITKAYVYDLTKDENGKIDGVKVLIKDEKVEIKSKIVIAADGVESRVGKWAGIDTTCKIDDMESCAQVTISGPEFIENELDLYFGKSVAPGGYIWVFPKGKNIANVGVGINVSDAKEKSATKYLEEFLEKHFPDAAILTRIAGGVPCAVTIDEIVKENIMLIGDAAHQVNPISGGGIITGMIGGMMAGEAAAEAIKKNDLNILNEYPKQWQKRLGWRHEIFHKLKDSVTNFDDNFFDDLAQNYSKLPINKQTLGGVFKTALWNKPTILVDLAKVFI